MVGGTGESRQTYRTAGARRSQFAATRRSGTRHAARDRALSIAGALDDHPRRTRSVHAPPLRRLRCGDVRSHALRAAGRRWCRLGSRATRRRRRRRRRTQPARRGPSRRRSAGRRIRGHAGRPGIPRSSLGSSRASPSSPTRSAAPGATRCSRSAPTRGSRERGARGRHPRARLAPREHARVLRARVGRARRREGRGGDRLAARRAGAPPPAIDPALRDHLLSPAEEKLLAETGPTGSSAWARLYGEILSRIACPYRAPRRGPRSR